MILKQEYLESLEKDIYLERVNRVARRAVTHNGVLEAAVNVFEDDSNRHTFNISLEETEIRSQKQSGRCWIFAALNVMEYKLCQKNNLESFELSQNYIYFYDKLERCNYFMESILKTMDEEVGSRLVSFLLTDPINDGGQWDMLKNIIKKYGVVPKYAMLESKNSSDSGALNRFLTKTLRMYAKNLRLAKSKGELKEKLESMVENYMKEIYKILTISLGTPPKTVDFEAVDKENHFISHKNLSPNQFFENFVSMNLDDYISLINAPTKDKPYYKSYTVKFLGNVVEGEEVKYVNVPIEVFKKVILAQLKDKEPVWFGCDVLQNFYRKGSSHFDFSTLRLDELFGMDIDFSKEDRLDYKESLMTHAMVFMGCDYDEEKNLIKRYKVENSWGEDAGNKGYFVMSDAWFDEYVYQVLIHKKHLEPTILAAYEEEAIKLEPWDPMGSLA